MLMVVALVLLFGLIPLLSRLVARAVESGKFPGTSSTLNGWMMDTPFKDVPFVRKLNLLFTFIALLPIAWLSKLLHSGPAENIAVIWVYCLSAGWIMFRK
jgi:hypothetical protein